VLVAQLAPRFLQHGHKTQLERLVKNAVEGNAWHADHIRAVYQVRVQLLLVVAACAEVR
jgi:hypothetical protein